MAISSTNSATIAHQLPAGHVLKECRLPDEQVEFRQSTLGQPSSTPTQNELLKLLYQPVAPLCFSIRINPLL